MRRNCVSKNKRENDPGRALIMTSRFHKHPHTCAHKTNTYKPTHAKISRFIRKEAKASPEGPPLPPAALQPRHLNQDPHHTHLSVTTCGLGGTCFEGTPILALHPARYHNHIQYFPSVSYVQLHTLFHISPLPTFNILGQAKIATYTI